MLSPFSWALDYALLKIILHIHVMVVSCWCVYELQGELLLWVYWKFYPVSGNAKLFKIVVVELYSIHTHTHPFNGPLSWTTRVGRYQKGKTNLDFIEARDSEWQWHQLSHMQICTLFQTDNHGSTSPLSFLQAGCPSCRRTASKHWRPIYIQYIMCNIILSRSVWCVYCWLSLSCVFKLKVVWMHLFCLNAFVCRWKKRSTNQPWTNFRRYSAWGLKLYF